MKDAKGFTLVEVMVVVGVLALVAAIAVPNYVRYAAKTRQSEARSNLSGIFVAQASYFGEFSQYGTFQQTGFSVAGNSNRYAYRVGAGTTAGVDLILPGLGAGDPGDNVLVNSGIAGGAAPGFTATATANLDRDPTIDMWHVNDLKQNLQAPDRNDTVL